jgi:hypothetical protein
MEHTRRIPLLNIALTDNPGVDSQHPGKTHDGPRNLIVIDNQ